MNLLNQVCWCDTQTKPMPAADVFAGIGWSCSPPCQEGCAPGVGVKHSTRTRRQRELDTERGTSSRQHRPCGTDAAYRRHLRNGEVCEVCLEGRRVHMQTTRPSRARRDAA